MKLLSFLYRIYFAFPNFGRLGKVGKAVDRAMAILLKRALDLFVPVSLSKRSKDVHGLNTTAREREYIVSLTSFPARIQDIWITIEIILRQTFKPDMVILWLSEDQFAGVQLPASIIKLKEKGLTIRFCEDDLRAHKKYFYAMQQFPNANIITIDDDLYYDERFLENLVDLHKKFPEAVVTNRAHRIKFDRQRKILPYRRWSHNVTDSKPSHLLIATGGAGTLYPPGALNPMVFDKKLFKEICFHADDIWLKIMAYLNRTLIVTNGKYNKDFVTIKSSQKEKLVTTNVLSGGNDVQLHATLSHFSINLAEAF